MYMHFNNSNLFILFILLLFIQCGQNSSESESKNNAQKIKNNHKTHETHGNHDDSSKGHSANHHMNKTNFEELVERFDSPERAEWQKPHLVIEKMGDISGKTVADLGAGSGYFSFLLAEKKAKVIALDADRRFVNFLEKTRDQKKISPDKFKVRKVPYNHPLLKKAEVDQVLIVNTYHHIEERVKYLEKLKNGIKRNGKIFIVDFKKKQPKGFDIGPPEKMRLSQEEVVFELRKAGFRNIDKDINTLPNQYIITVNL